MEVNKATLEKVRTTVGPFAERAARGFGILISALLLVIIYREFLNADLSFFHGGIASSPLFWSIFVASYFISPLCEWIIYNRLWGFDWRAFPALVRKLVSNELLLGYLGELQFTVWAHTRHGHRLSPVHAVKDVTILSALTGNIVTLVLLALAWPLLTVSQLGALGRGVFVGLAFVLATSFAALFARRQIFSFKRSELAEIATIQIARTVVALILSAAMWHLVIPDQSWSSWFLLATLRMLVSRLPLVPNKDLVFAGMTILIFGPSTQIAALMATMAGLIMLAHLAVGGSLAAVSLFWFRKD